MRSSYKAFSQLVIKGGGPSPLWVEPSLAQPIVGGAIPGLVDLGSRRRQDEQHQSSQQCKGFALLVLMSY